MKEINNRRNVYNDVFGNKNFGCIGIYGITK